MSVCRTAAGCCSLLWFYRFELYNAVLLEQHPRTGKTRASCSSQQQYGILCMIMLAHAIGFVKLGVFKDCL